jgi:S-DNA-T family DNA segregation ATPase FtsK/SpoIIIE
MEHERLKITLKAGQSIGDIEKIQPELESYLWASEVQISGFGRTVYLDIYRGQLPKDIPYILPEQDPEGLEVPIGYNMQGELIMLDMGSDSLCYLLGAGYQGTGKSVLAKGIVHAVMQYPVEWVRLVLIDLKMGVEFQRWNNDPHVWLKATDPEKGELKHVLKMLNTEIRNRYIRFQEKGVNDIHQYRLHIGPMNYIMLIVDEFAELANAPDGEEMQTLVKRTLNVGRAAGLRCALFTQRPTVDVVNGGIKALFPTRIALRCATKLESKIILDVKGAERLEGIPGRAILLSDARFQKVQVMHYI